MAFLSALPLALLLVALLGQQAGARAGLSGRCPPKGFRALPASKFNITEYIAAPWYAQRQVRGRIRGQASAAAQGGGYRVAAAAAALPGGAQYITAD